MAREKLVYEVPLFLGLNLADTDEACEVGECRDLTNYDVDDWGGGSGFVLGSGLEAPLSGVLRIRPGWTLFDTLEVSNVLGLTQWDAPGVPRQNVAVNGGDLWFSSTSGGVFDSKLLSGLSATQFCIFVPFRVGGNEVLFFANGGLRSWNGAALTVTYATAPAAKFIAQYKGRMFATDGTKRLYWSKIGDPTLWDTPSGGGFADIETGDDKPLVGLAVVGSSLLIVKDGSVARFTGVDPDTVQIDVETEGVSPVVGAEIPTTIARVENTVFLIDRRTMYLASETGVAEIGRKVTPILPVEADRAEMRAAYDPNRRGIWLALKEKVYCWRIGSGRWTGPWTSPTVLTGGVTIKSLGFLALAGTPGRMALGLSDGNVLMEDPTQTVANDFNIERVQPNWTLPAFVGSRRDTVKHVRRITISASYPTSEQTAVLQLVWSGDFGNAGSVVNFFEQAIVAPNPTMVRTATRRVGAVGTRIIFSVACDAVGELDRRRVVTGMRWEYYETRRT